VSRRAARFRTGGCAAIHDDLQIQERFSALRERELDGIGRFLQVKATQRRAWSGPP
jgi:hypothetical protein